MEGWHVYDRHDKAVPYDVFIKRAKGQKKKKKRCDDKIQDLSGTRSPVHLLIYNVTSCNICSVPRLMHQMCSVRDIKCWSANATRSTLV